MLVICIKTYIKINQEKISERRRKRDLTNVEYRDCCKRHLILRYPD